MFQPSYLARYIYITMTRPHTAAIKLSQFMLLAVYLGLTYFRMHYESKLKPKLELSLAAEV